MASLYMIFKYKVLMSKECPPEYSTFQIDYNYFTAKIKKNREVMKCFEHKKNGYACRRYDQCQVTEEKLNQKMVDLNISLFTTWRNKF